jgi:apolipoprotein N-acyltransferase
VLINGTVASIAERVLRPRSDVPRWTRSVETLLPFAAIWGLYAVSTQFCGSPADEGEGKVLRVAMVQRNFPCVFERGREENPVEVYRSLLGNVSPLQPDLVVLAESAFSEVGLFGSANALRFADWMREQSGAKGVLAGGVRFADGKEYNSAALYGDGTVDIYDKVHLVPFGEYIPGDKWITALQKLAPVGSCTPGELKTLDFGGTKLGVAICYEDTDSAQVRRLAAMGAQVLVFITNDSWFSHSDEAVQHAWQSVARAVETGLPIVRVGNSGVTGTVKPVAGLGATTWLIGEDGKPLVDARGTMFDRISIRVPGESTGVTALTPYVVLGDAPVFAAFLLLLSGFFAAKFFLNPPLR